MGTNIKRKHTEKPTPTPRRAFWIPNEVYKWLGHRAIDTNTNRSGVLIELCRREMVKQVGRT